jgi:hypothetical protein
MTLWLIYIIAAVLLLGAIVLLHWGLWGDRNKGQLRCPKCWYDMQGSHVGGSLECPECGHDAKVENRLMKHRRRWWAITLGLLAISTYLYLLSFSVLVRVTILDYFGPSLGPDYILTATQYPPANQLAKLFYAPIILALEADGQFEWADDKYTAESGRSFFESFILK